eukprot:5571559-Pleurochrysis_carterae.AAC.1
MISDIALLGPRPKASPGDAVFSVADSRTDSRNCCQDSMHANEGPRQHVKSAELRIKPSM